MREFFTNVYSPSWWIGVVLVSFFINLASAYAKHHWTVCGLAIPHAADPSSNKIEKSLIDNSQTSCQCRMASSS